MIRNISVRLATITIVVAAGTLVSWFVFSWITGATLITFRTGSMAPTMPQGSLALSMPVAAADLKVGDVVTVQREDSPLPVTHRIVAIAQAPSADSNSSGNAGASMGTGASESGTAGASLGPHSNMGADNTGADKARAGSSSSGPAGEASRQVRVLTLQGDDNAAPDMLPYEVSEARRVLAAVPHAGNVLMMLQTPLGMGLLTLGAGALTAWAFWPERRVPRHAEPKASRRQVVGERR